MKQERNAAAYIRVSTEDQVEYSPNAQLAEIRKYAAQNGYLIPERFVFSDEGISGKQTAKRDGFNHMIGMAKQKPRPFDAILLWKFSRFARNREDSVVYKSMLRKQLGIEVISVSEPVGDDKMSILIEALIEAMDEYYSINLAEEVRRGMTEKARRGGLQATPAFGYCVKNHQLIPIPKEAALVRAMFSRFIDGEGLFPMAKWLNGMGVTTHRGSPFENRTVEYILRNPVYIGKLRWNPSGHTGRDFLNENIILAEGGHEALVSMERWEAAQNRMAQVKAQWKYHGRPLSAHRDWMSGLLRCADCGSTLVFSKPHYWKCNGYARGTCSSSQHTTEARLKEMLLARMAHDALSSVSLSPSILPKKPDDEEAFFADQRGELEKKLSRLRAAYLAGVETLESYSAAKTVLEAQKEAIKAANRPPVDSKESQDLLRQNGLNCVTLLKSPAVSMEEKQRAMHDMIENCTYSKSENTLKLSYRIHI